MRIVPSALALAAVVSAAACSSASSASAGPAASAAHGLVGTWRLILYENVRNGRRETPHGEHPRGYFVYDPTGHVSVHIMRTPPLAAARSGQPAFPSAEQKVAAYDAYVGYFGTYTVGAAGGVVIHHVEASLDPSYTDTDQPRPFVLTGDSLIIGDRVTWKRVLQRVRS